MQQNLRLFLWLGLALAIWLNVEAWLKDYGATEAPASAPTKLVAPPSASRLDATVPNTAPAGPVSQPPATAAVPAPSTLSAPRVRVTTDVYDVEISTRGGDLVSASLLAYPLRKDEPDVKVRLFNDPPDGDPYVLQTGLTSGRGGPEPNHLAL